MNILIIGEFSGFARNLKEGFIKLGHQVLIVQSGDGWKKLDSKEDIILKKKSLFVRGHHILGSNRIMSVFENIRFDNVLCKNSPNPDLIFVVNYEFIRENITKIGVSRNYIKRCIRKGAKLLMSECGTSPAGCYYDKNYYCDLLKKKVPLIERRYSFLLTNSHAIIPTSFCYYEQLLAYSKVFLFDTKKIQLPIPLPITIRDYDITPCQGRKIVIFHGVIRPKAKGTSFIQAAMERLQREMPDRVECVCKGGMAYAEYVKLFDKVDVLVDQTYLNGWGMNAAIAAMKGKCVLTSCGPENSENMGIPNIPYVQIKPDSKQIYQTLKNLILHPDKIDEIKKQSREFSEKYCDSVVVAARYFDKVGLCV